MVRRSEWYRFSLGSYYRKRAFRLRTEIIVRHGTFIVSTDGRATLSNALPGHGSGRTESAIGLLGETGAVVAEGPIGIGAVGEFGGAGDHRLPRRQVGEQSVGSVNVEFREHVVE